MYRTRLHAKTLYIMKILVVNGPNLNLLGQREPGIYGTDSMEACLASLRERYADDEIDYYQSNVEGFLIDRLQQTLTDGTERWTASSSTPPPTPTPAWRCTMPYVRSTCP